MYGGYSALNHGKEGGFFLRGGSPKNCVDQVLKGLATKEQ